MAGRPAPSRGGGLTGLHYGLFSFVFITVLALVGFVLQLTKVKDLQSRNSRLEAKSERFGISQAPSYFEDEAVNRRSTVFAVVNQQFQDLAQLVTGKSNDRAPDILVEANRRLKAVAEQHPTTVNETDTLLTAVNSLGKALGKERKRNDALTDTLGEEQRKNESLNNQISEEQKQFQDAVAGLNERITELDRVHGEAFGAKDQQLDEIQRNLDAKTQQLTKLQQENVNESGVKDREIRRLGGLIASLRDQVRVLNPNTFDPDAILTKADGRVMRAIAGGEIVYINLGLNQNLKVGMGFEVYSQHRETPKGLRGKASVEIVALMSDTAECRVTRFTPDEPIIEGDLLVNIAYERNRKPKFVVKGDFDLDYDGVVDFDGPEKIKSMIREWGGQVADALDERTNFVVIGAAPFSPVVAQGLPVSPIVLEQIREKQKQRSRFQDLIKQAQSIFIPVITQDQFLFLTGFTGS